MMWSFQAIFVTQMDEISQLRHSLTHTPADTFKVWILRDLAYYYQSIDADSAIYYARLGTNLAHQLRFPSGQIWCLYQEGLAYETKNLLDSSFFTYDHAIEIAQESGDKLSQAKLFNAVGVSHYMTGNFHDAVKYYHMGYELSDSLQYLEGTSYALNNMAVIYRQQRRYDQALVLYEKSLAIKRAERDTAGIISGLYNIGLAFSYLDQHSESLDALLDAELLSMQYSGVVTQIPNIAIGIGVAHYNLGNISESRRYLEAGIAGARNLTPEKVSGLAYLGSVEVMQRQVARGLELIEEAYALSLHSGRKELLRAILKERAKAVEQAGDLKLSNESWKAYNAISDSLNQESNRWAMEEMQGRFELLEKENLIHLQQLRLEREATQRIWYLVFGLLLLGVLITITLFLRKIMKQQKQLTLEAEKKDEALKENDLLFREMHHRTKNNLQLLNSILSLHSRNVHHEAARKALESSRDSVGALSLLHQQLYQTKDLRHIAFQTYVRNICSYFQAAFSLDDRNIRLDFQCEAFYLDIDRAIPIGLVINEMLTNCIKHAFPGLDQGKIDLRANKEKSQITIIVEDNGVGFSGLVEAHLGTGKKLIQLFCDKFEADFEFIDKPEGTMAKFCIPI